MRWAFSWRWYVCSAFNRDRNRPVAGPPVNGISVYRWTGQRGIARVRLAEQPFLPRTWRVSDGPRAEGVRERERGRGEGGRGGAPLSNDRVARFPRSRFDCLVRQGDLACNCRCCFQTYARNACVVFLFVAEATLLVALVPWRGRQRGRAQPRKRGHTWTPQRTGAR